MVLLLGSVGDVHCGRSWGSVILNQAEFRPSFFSSPPCLALPLPFRGMPPQMERYIVQGGDVNKPNKLGDTPLHEVRSSESGVRV